MGASEKTSIWHSLSSSYRQERRERKVATTKTTTSPTHYPSWTRGRTRSSNTSNSPRELSSDLPPPYAELPTIKVSAPEEIESDSDSLFAFLSQFHTIFLVDDSTSMRGKSWQEAREAIAAIAPVCTAYDKEGIDIYFINHRSKPNTNSSYSSNYNTSTSKCPQFGGGYYNIRTAQRVSEIFASVRPAGGTAAGSRLRDILGPYVDLVEETETAKRAQNHAFGWDRGMTESVTPINIITITDGEFTDDAESVIIQTARKLDGPCCAIPWQVGIQFFQIGNDKMAQKYLEELDEDLGRRCNDLHLRDIVDTVSWKNRNGERLEGDGILKAVLGAVNKRLDRKKV
ncbi:von Willebrand factor type A [Penicillium cf. griseofulvum]|uniref:von Willebrand factor type A n=1 Tax=Penicillium cf. griseofulvum TaxID=2972120 RepID=A0A9W9N0P2_9EURO|nr:von Willebrand factor type A [Penicillium cf. griseofulvum]KAJ5422453.1 von Willebrand factor type A [Penicillium cf. griseofulvum]KAJ5428631.1 von Willebrand factor type A [Penicillium cf. griseofulvum]